MATRYWIHRRNEDGDDEQISNPFDHEAAANHAAELLNREVDGEEYYVDTPHNHVEASSAADVFPS